jgi:hypothetical protein
MCSSVLLAAWRSPSGRDPAVVIFLSAEIRLTLLPNGKLKHGLHMAS